MAKFIVVSGGVISGIGKGVSSASIGLLLKMRGIPVNIIKFDPYLNISASLLSPYQHGESFVCDDGSETDLDLGTYERITGVEVSNKNILTSGTVYKEILDEEVHGKYMGQTVQINPHATDKILNRLHLLSKEIGKDGIVIAEIGGTVGDAESEPFFEAVRQLRLKEGEKNVLLVHVAPILWINTIKEFKTKPLQNSIKDLNKTGLTPNILLCRVDRPVPKSLMDKISHLTGIDRDAIFEAPDTATIYQVPIAFYERHIDDLIADKFSLARNGVRIYQWRNLVERLIDPELPICKVAIVGKYAAMQDAYLSLKEALIHASANQNVKLEIAWIDAEEVEKQSDNEIAKSFSGIDAVIIPGGFDSRGIEGKIKAIKYVRENKIPFLGICLGLQCAVIEYARNVCGITNANSQEFNDDTSISHVIHFIEGMEKIKKKGGTLRLGSYPCTLAKNSLVAALYKRKNIEERHRHRYEVNNDFRKNLEDKGLLVSGVNPDVGLVEIMELEADNHPFFVGCQFHPEFKSRLDHPHPLFVGLLQIASKGKIQEKNTN